eukprot:gene12932-17339_t
MSNTKHDYSKVLPVLFMEYLALSLARTLFPSMIVSTFGRYSYIAVGVTETVKGILAFVSCPLFGGLSDRIGRKYCLLATVVGTVFPVCIMAFTTNMWIYSIAFGMSGFFAATFALTFAYISDCVEPKNRAPAYGLALATFGLSFCFGPIIGSYIANEFGNQVVFILSCVLVIMDIIYIIFVLPETAKSVNSSQHYSQKIGLAMEYLPSTWNFSETFRVFRSDVFMSNIAVIVFIYYTSVWAIVSTLMVYITQQLHFSKVSLGWLLAGYGLATMFSEGILVRVIVPRIGELNSMRLGLVSFSIQCVFVAIGSSSQMIYMSILFSMLSNLVYPSVSSLVSKVVNEESQGEALGALNGIKALTEGFGPLLFGFLMSLFENTPQPGAPYLLAALLSFWAFLHCFELPTKDLDVIYAKYDSQRKGYDDSNGLLASDNYSEYEA